MNVRGTEEIETDWTAKVALLEVLKRRNGRVMIASVA
jgi:hypothetical protein